MKITDWLRLQHREFRMLLRQMQVAQHDPGPHGATELRGLLKRLLPLLRLHEAVEDGMLAPALRGRMAGMDETLRGIFSEGHEDLHEKLEHLEEALDMGTAPLSQFVAAVDFESLLEEHMTQEEAILFSLADKVLDLRTQGELGQRAEESLRKALGRPSQEIET